MKLNIHFKLHYDPLNEAGIEERAKLTIAEEVGTHLSNMMDISISRNVMSNPELPTKNVSSEIVALNEEEVGRLKKVLTLIKYEYPIQYEINAAIASIT